MPWWYSQDEERWNGPCDTRAEAVAEGRDAWDGEAFAVCEGEQGPYDLTLDHYDILERLEVQNEELLDPEGDGIFTDATKEQRKDLEVMVSDAIAAWATKHSLSTQAWGFVKQGKSESIPSEDDDCTCREQFASPTDIDPPEGKIRDKNCPVHGVDPDAARDREQDR